MFNPNKRKLLSAYETNAINRLLVGSTKVVDSNSIANWATAFSNIYPSVPGILNAASTGTTNTIQSDLDTIQIKDLTLRFDLKSKNTTVTSRNNVVARLVVIWDYHPTGNAAGTGTEAVVGDFLYTPNSILSQMKMPQENAGRFHVLHDEDIIVGNTETGPPPYQIVERKIIINKPMVTSVPGSYTYQYVTKGMPYVILMAAGDLGTSYNCAWSSGSATRLTYIG